MKKKQKKSANKKSSHEIVVRVESQNQAIVIPTEDQIVEPMHEGKKLAITKTWVSDRQIMKMVQRTPKEHIYTRPGKGGQSWNYVTGNYVEKVLNFVFGFLWDFEVVEHGKEGDLVWVKGKLTVKNPNGDTISKMQFGRAEIKFKKGTKEMLDYGNDLKAASTDALKKCASLLGIASDIYGKTEYKQETGIEVRTVQASPQNTPTVAKPPVEQGIKCQYPKCQNTLTFNEAQYSVKMYNGKRVCREHQDKINFNK